MNREYTKQCIYIWRSRFCPVDRKNMYCLTLLAWLFLAAPGCPWLLLATPGRSLLLLAAPGCPWTDQILLHFGDTVINAVQKKYHVCHWPPPTTNPAPSVCSRAAQDSVRPLPATPNCKPRATLATLLATVVLTTLTHRRKNNTSVNDKANAVASEACASLPRHNKQACATCLHVGHNV